MKQLSLPLTMFNIGKSLCIRVRDITPDMVVKFSGSLPPYRLKHARGGVFRFCPYYTTAYGYTKNSPGNMRNRYKESRFPYNCERISNIREVGQNSNEIVYLIELL